jgi:tetratricopeptide (TPR) repeat protein
MSAALLLTLGLLAGAAEPRPALEQAEAYALRGEADAALELYRSVLEQGHDFAALRYNLGTLSLERGELGPAVLHLRAALRHDPRLEDARFNLARALESRDDRVEGGAAPAASWTDVASVVRSSEAALAFGLLVLLLVLALSLWPWTHPQSAARRLCSGALALFGSGLGLCALLLFARVRADDAAEAVVIEEEVAARAGPALDAAVRFVAHAGLFGDVIEEEGGWLRLRLPNGLDAWLPRTSLGVLGRGR